MDPFMALLAELGTRAKIAEARNQLYEEKIAGLEKELEALRPKDEKKDAKAK